MLPAAIHLLSRLLPYQACILHSVPSLGCLLLHLRREHSGCIGTLRCSSGFHVIHLSWSLWQVRRAVGGFVLGGARPRAPSAQERCMSMLRAVGHCDGPHGHFCVCLFLLQRLSPNERIGLLQREIERARAAHRTANMKAERSTN